MMAFTYALILFFTVIICFIASFDKRLQFNRHFGAFIKLRFWWQFLSSLGMFGLRQKAFGGSIPIIRLA